MQNKLSDTDIVRLIAYVTPVSFNEEDQNEEDQNEDEISAEYLIEYLTVGEAKNIGSEGLLSKSVEVLFNKKIIGNDINAAQVTWRLLPDGAWTPIELNNKDEDVTSYKVRDLRHLH